MECALGAISWQELPPHGGGLTFFLFEVQGHKPLRVGLAFVGSLTICNMPCLFFSVVLGTSDRAYHPYGGA